MLKKDYFITFLLSVVMLLIKCNDELCYPRFSGAEKQKARRVSTQRALLNN
jgi:hypothetical protein